LKADDDETADLPMPAVEMKRIAFIEPRQTKVILLRSASYDVTGRKDFPSLRFMA